MVGSGLECGFSLLTDGINGFRRILGTIHGGTCDQYVGTGLGYNVRGLRADTAIDLNLGGEAATGNLVTQTTYLGHLVVKELLATEAGARRS